MCPVVVFNHPKHLSSMPVLFDVGPFPLFQLSLAGLFLIYVARHVVGNKHYTTGKNNIDHEERGK